MDTNLTSKIKSDFDQIQKIFNNENNRHVYSANAALSNLVQDINCGFITKRNVGSFPFYFKSITEIENKLKEYENKAKISPVAYRLRLRNEMLSNLLSLLRDREVLDQHISQVNNAPRFFHVYMIYRTGSRTPDEFWYKFNQNYFNNFLADYLELEISSIHSALKTQIKIKDSAFFSDFYKNYLLEKSEEAGNFSQQSQITLDVVEKKENSFGKTISSPVSAEKILERVNLTRESPDKGYVYVLINRAIPDFIKIGKTTKLPEIRASELSTSTGVPVPYQVYHAVFVNDCSRMEKEIHNKLIHCRENLGREFFRLRPDEAKAILDELSVKYKL